jgi:ketosteroid isomerase-like protein
MMSREVNPMPAILRLVAPAALALSLATPAAASEADILAAEKGWSTAVVGRDFAALDAWLHADLIYSHSTGVVESKAEYFGKLRDGVSRYDVIDYERTKVELFGDAAVTHSIVSMKGQSGETAFDVHLIMLHVWIESGKGWQLAAHQTTLLDR